MKYMANPCGNPRVIAAMQQGQLGMITTPAQGNPVPVGVEWIADNGVFGRGFPGTGAWYSWLAKLEPDKRERCLFATAPDVVGDAWATHMRSMPWLPRIRELGYKAAYVIQNGARADRLPWGHFQAVFIGGDTAWKLDRSARAIVYEAKQRGVHVHMGRVNSERRFRYAQAIGCDSVDGTYLTYGPDQNLPNVLAWNRTNDQPGLFGINGQAC